jgi:hypothetical protein
MEDEMSQAGDNVASSVEQAYVADFSGVVDEVGLELMFAIEPWR